MVAQSRNLIRPPAVKGRIRSYSAGALFSSG